MKYSEYVIRVQMDGDQGTLVETFVAKNFHAALDLWDKRLAEEWPRYRQLGAKYMIMAGCFEGKGYPLRSVKPVPARDIP